MNSGIYPAAAEKSLLKFDITSLATRPIFWITFLVLWLLTYFIFDRIVCDYFFAHPLAGYIDKLSILGKGWRYVLLFLCLSLIQKMRHHILSSSQWLWMAAWLSFAYSLCGVLKVFFGRARPILWVQDHIYGFYGWHLTDAYWSFPSGHVTTYMSLALGASIIKPKFSIYFIACALLLSSVRVIFLHHYISDVLATSALTLVLLIIFRKLVSKQKIWEHMS